MMRWNRGRDTVKTAKIAITLDAALLRRVDEVVQAQRFPSRSRFIQEAIKDKIKRPNKTRLARECAKLDPKVEQQLAEEGFVKDMEEWPEY